MGAVPDQQVTRARSHRLEVGGAFALGLLLFFPFVYYPVATAIWLVAPDVAGVYKQALAGGAAVLTVGFLLLILARDRREIWEGWSWGSILRTPQTWGLAFLGWILVVTTFQREPSSVQNLIVYTVFFAALLLAPFVCDLLAAAVRVFVSSSVPILLVVGLWEAVADPLSSSIGLQLGGPRLYASYAVIAVVGLFAIPSAIWLRLVLGGGLFAGAVISNSRASMTTILVVLIIGLLVTAPYFWRRFSLVVPAGAIAFVFALMSPGIRAQMLTRNISTPGVPINDSGRLRVWIPTFESWTTQPVVGLGAGSSQTVSGESEFPLDHPHNEYLRILHDSGLIGFVLFAAFVVVALLWLWPRTGGRPRNELVVAGFLIVVAGLVLGTIENYLVFPSLMWPAAVFLGLGFAAARRDGQSPLDPRRRVRAASNENTELPQT